MTSSIREPGDEQERDMLTVATEECSSNFYWIAGREHKFHVQTTIRGNPTPMEIKAHLQSALSGMAMVINDFKGEAKAVGQSPPARPAQNGQGAFKFTSYKGKTYVEMTDPNAEFPKAVTCPIHEVAAQGKDGNYGWFWSHKDGEEWCRIGLRKK